MKYLPKYDMVGGYWTMSIVYVRLVLWFSVFKLIEQPTQSNQNLDTLHQPVLSIKFNRNIKQSVPFLTTAHRPFNWTSKKAIENLCLILRRDGPCLV